MASSKKICCYCSNHLAVPQDGRRLKDSIFSNMCDPCFAAFEEGNFCTQFHKYEAGWRKCDGCETQLHCGCIMAWNSFDVSGTSGIICNECAAKESLQASNVGASSSVPVPVTNPVDFYQLNVVSTTENFTVEESLMDPEIAALLNDDPLPENAAIGGSINLSQLPDSTHSFLFEKRLSATDCDTKYGRMALPKQPVEEYLPMRPGETRMPVTMKDTEGLTWYFKICCSPRKRSRKYVLEGIRKCIQRKNWAPGDTVKFYRQLPEGDLVMELQKANSWTSTS